MEKTLDEALAEADENLAELQHIHNVTAELNLQQICATWLSLFKKKRENIK